MEDKTGQWLIVVFDVLLAALFVWLLLGNITELRRPALDATASDILISRAACGLDVLALVSQLCAAFALTSGRRSSALLQRAVFWGLLIRTVFIFMEGTLPSEGGVGGFLLIIAFLFFLVLTGLALWSAAYLHKAERSAA